MKFYVNLRFRRFDYFSPLSSEMSRSNAVTEWNGGAVVAAADPAIYLDAIAIKTFSVRSEFCCYSIHILLAHCRRRTSVLLCGWSNNCLEWLKYMNKQRRARIHSPHNCLSTCRTNGWTPLFDFKQTDKQKIMRDILLVRALSFSLLPFGCLFPWLVQHT